MTKTKLYIISIMMLLLLTSLVSAGTLTSGTKLKIESNYQDIDGLSLVGEWSTTPAANDYLQIYDSLLDDSAGDYKLEKSFKVYVDQPIFEQVFDVTEQQPIFLAGAQEGRYYYWDLPGGKTPLAQCMEELQDDGWGSLNLLPNTYIVIDENSIYCDARAAYVYEHKGYVGNVQFSNWHYDQDIRFENGKRLRLTSNDKISQLSDIIPNYAKATLLGFSGWTVAPLPASDVYAYHYKSKIDGSGEWKPFERVDFLSTYNDAYASIEEIQTSTRVGDFSGDVSELIRQINILNTQVERTVYVSKTPPISWGNVGKLNLIRYSGNTIIVPLDKTVMTANIQLVLKGDAFGLVIPTGKPKVYCSKSSVTFDEVGYYNYEYRAENIGDGQGAFSANVYCSPSGIDAQGDDFTLNAGSRKDGTILLTGKTSTNSDQTFSCKLEVQETTTKEKDTCLFNVNLKVKDACVDGQEKAPVVDGSVWRVDILNVNCDVKDTKTCPNDATHQFKLVGGKWECQEVSTPPGNGGDGNDDDGINKTLMWVTIILAGVGGLIAFSMFPTFGIKKGWIIKLIVGVAVFVLIFIFVPKLVQGVTGLIKPLFQLGSFVVTEVLIK